MSFAIRELPVGGGVLALCPMPGRGGEFADDVARVLDWAPDLVVSMTGAAEMAAARDLPHVLAQGGVGWRHYPVGDFGVPDDKGDAGWPALAGEMQAVLVQGGRVLLHCLGGCGRSGMVALALMVRAGEAPDTALARLRAVRPCAVETAAQLAWASDQAEGTRA